MSRPLSKEEKDVISQVFPSDISLNVQVLLPIVRNKMRAHALLRPLVPKANMVKKVADRVRHCQQTEKRTQPEQLETEPTSKRVEDWLKDMSVGGNESVSSTREEWSEEDTAEITNRFLHLDKCPVKSDLILAFEETSALKDIYQRKGFSKCRDKIKNMLRKK